MSEELEGFIILTSGFVVFVYGLLKWIINGKTRAQKFIEKAQKNGCTAQAEIVDSWYLRESTHNNGNHIEKRKYEYRVAGKTYYKIYKFECGVTRIPPYSITLYYSKHNPKKVVPGWKNTRQAQVQTGCGFTALAVFCTMFLVAKILQHIV